MSPPRYVGVCAAVLMLAACQPPASPAVADSGAAPGPHAPASAATTGLGTRYRCADGSVVEARYPTEDSAHIVYKGQSIEMKLAISADGARYTGGGWQWWTKGLTQGYLSPLAAGEEIASARGVDCTAR